MNFANDFYGRISKKKETFVDKTKRKLSKLSSKVKSNIFLYIVYCAFQYVHESKLPFERSKKNLKNDSRD